MIYEDDMFGDYSPSKRYRENYDNIFGDTKMASKKKPAKKYEDSKMDKKMDKEGMKKMNMMKKKGK